MVKRGGLLIWLFVNLVVIVAMASLIAAVAH